MHYIDLADGRAFVQDISTLDAAARQAGVLVVSGASSVPALSGAAADHLAQGLAAVDAIDIGISPGNRTERGLSTVQAILSYCGKPLPSPREPVFGWRGTWRHRYPTPVGERLMSPCDVPDLTLFPARYPGTPRVRFGAGLELRLLHRGMNLMAALVRAGLVRDWSRHARWLKAVSEWLLPYGSDAGAMHVRVEGAMAATRRGPRMAPGGRARRRPVRADAGRCRAGAPLSRRHAAAARRTAVHRPADPGGFRARNRGPRHHHAGHACMTASLYETLLGARYAQLAPAVQAFHRLSGRVVLHGEVETQPPASRAARWLAWCIRTPRTMTRGPIRFTLEAASAQETWTRQFPRHVMRSTLSLGDGHLVERLGAVRLRFTLEAVDRALHMRLRGLRFLGIPCPAWLRPEVVAEETGDGDRLHFNVRASVPLLGVVAAYRGHLDLATTASA